MIYRTLPEASNIPAYLSSGHTDSFSLVVPLAAENLIENPSFEVGGGITSYIGYNATLSASTSYQRRGSFSCKVVVTVANGYIYYLTANLTSGVTYTWSFDVYTAKTVVASVLNPALSVVYSLTTDSAGYWKRYSITFVANASGVFSLKIGCSTTDTFYTDGWMLIASSYTTTYLDGSLHGEVRNRVDYYWASIENNSRSTRIANCRTGGRIINFSELGIRTIAVIGMSGIAKQLITVPNSFAGSIYQRSTVQERQITIVVDVMAVARYELEYILSYLSSVLSNSIVYPDQPALLLYTPLDDTGQQVGETLEILAYYEGGLDQFPVSINKTARLALSFRITTPYSARRMGNMSSSSVMYSSMTAYNEILFARDPITYAYTSYTAAGILYTLSQPIGSNYIILGGTGIYTIEGVSTGVVAKFNRSTKTFSAIDAGNIPSSGDIYCSCVIPGTTKVLVGGNFTWGFVTGSNLALISSLSTWGNVGGGYSGSYGTDGAVRCMATDPTNSNYIYMGGSFTTAGGTSANYIAKYNVASDSFTAVGSGFDGDVYSIVVSALGTVYACGNFGHSGGTSINGIAKWDGSTWSQVGSSGISPLYYDPTKPMTLKILADGNLYMSGTFHMVDDKLVYGIAKWDGISWNALGAGLQQSTASGKVGNVYCIEEIDGLLYAVGWFDTAGGLSGCYGMAYWDGFSWNRSDARYHTSFTITRFTYIAADIYTRTLYMGVYSSNASDRVHIPSNLLLTNMGIETYPTIIFPPGTPLYVRNLNTGKAVYFDGLTIEANEVVSLICAYDRMSLFSSVRGNVSNYIIPSSDLMYFQEGSNSLLIYGAADVGAGVVYIQWKENYAALKTVVV